MHFTSNFKQWEHYSEKGVIFFKIFMNGLEKLEW